MKKRLFCLAALFVLCACLFPILASCSCSDYIAERILVYTPNFTNGYQYDYLFDGYTFSDEVIRSIDGTEVKVGHMSVLQNRVEINSAASDPNQTIAWSFVKAEYSFIRKDMLFDNYQNYDKWGLDGITLRYNRKSGSEKDGFYESEPLLFDAEQPFTLWDLVELDQPYDLDQASDTPFYKGPTIYLYPHELSQYCFRFSQRHIIVADDGFLYLGPEMPVWLDNQYPHLQTPRYFKIKDEYLDFFLHPVFPDMPEDVYAELFPEQSTEPTEDPATAPATPAP